MALISNPKYRAFISYSHADNSWAAWLHKRLERHRIPADLIGRQTPQGPVPSVLRPIFRDREDFAGGTTLIGATLTALDESAALIVICSQASAASKAVNEEIRLFRWRHPERPVIPVIVGGRPPENFAPALLYHINPDGSVGNEPQFILGPDLREEGDGRELGFAKIISCLIGVETDKIVRRTTRVERQRRFFGIAASVAGMVMIVPAFFYLLTFVSNPLTTISVPATIILTALASFYVVSQQRQNRFVAIANVLEDVPNRILYLNIISHGQKHRSIESVRLKRIKTNRLLSDNIVDGEVNKDLSNGQELAVKYRLSADAEHATREGQAYIEITLDGKQRRIAIKKTTSELIRGFDPTELAAPGRSKIFISYRRSDAAHVAGRIFDYLEAKYGAGQVILDVGGAFDAGDEFRSKIRTYIADSRAVVAIISHDWKRGIVKAGWAKRNLGKKKEDYILFELALAFASRADVYPVFVDGCRMPDWAALPDSISQIATFEGVPVGTGIQFREDMAKIVKVIDKIEEPARIAQPSAI